MAASPLTEQAKPIPSGQATGGCATPGLDLRASVGYRRGGQPITATCRAGRTAGHALTCVLLVDDCADAVASLGILLRLWGYEPLGAHDGPTALALAATYRPDVVLLDIGLPGAMDGYEAARRLRGQPGTAPALLVAL